jgi:hypothetical protein
MTKKAISIADLNARKDAAQGHEIELKIPGATDGLGVFLTILGEQAQIVEDFEVELADKRAQESLEAAQDGKAKPRSARQTLKDNLERALVRVIGWRGLTETYSPELARTLLANNPDFVDQVLAESRNRGNFTKA